MMRCLQTIRNGYQQTITRSARSARPAQDHHVSKKPIEQTSETVCELNALSLCVRSQYTFKSTYLIKIQFMLQVHIKYFIHMPSYEQL